MITLIPATSVPEEFRQKANRPYPTDNLVEFEHWFGENYDCLRNNSDRIYLPIYFTSYYNNHKHGRDKRALRRLQEYLDRLDRRKKYFCVIQNDDGILNTVSHLDLKIFGMGCKGDVQLPLVCQPHKYEFKETGRPIFASFIGSITHPIREQMVKELQGKEGYFISTEPTSLHSYCYILSQSRYVICCRGYGGTSFRIAESLQFGATPIYLSPDEFLFTKGCLLFKSINELLSFLPNEVARSPEPEYNKRVFKDHYTYEAVANRIYENL